MCVRAKVFVCVCVCVGEFLYVSTYVFCTCACVVVSKWCAFPYVCGFAWIHAGGTVCALCACVRLHACALRVLACARECGFIQMWVHVSQSCVRQLMLLRLCYCECGRVYLLSMCLCCVLWRTVCMLAFLHLRARVLARGLSFLIVRGFLMCPCICVLARGFSYKHKHA